MAEFGGFFRGLSAGSRWAFAAGCVLIVALVAWFAWWAMRAPYGVLFSDLAEQDTAAIVQELDTLKVPYQIGPDGNAILVPEATVHKTRLALMGRQLPLHGAVGFELFNTTEFGVSDFVQKVNYQRALQGELTRTILAIEQVQSARVHLALPEQGLFRRDASKAKASVTVVTRPGQQLQAGQVTGIQRLVAASVPEVRAEDVTVLDQHGVTLSRAGGDETSVSPDAGPELEARLTHKATQVLDRMFGAGQALVTVDAVINLQQSRVTTEEVLAARGLDKDATPAGVVVRERSTVREAASAAAGEQPASTQITSQELEYQAGKRVEQIVSPSGAVTRLNVAVVIKPALSDAEVSRVRELVAAAVGLQPVRGDVIAVQSLSTPTPVVEELQAPVSRPLPPERPHSVVPSPAHPALAFLEKWGVALVAGLLLSILLIALLAWPSRRRAQRRGAVEPTSERHLSAAEREAMLKSLHDWLAVPEARRGT